jgi:hypothetical protein
MMHRYVSHAFCSLTLDNTVILYSLEGTSHALAGQVRELQELRIPGTPHHILIGGF